MSERISSEDMKEILDAQNQVKLTAAEAKAAVAISKMTESEFNFKTLQLFVKYTLTPGVDVIQPDGSILKKSKPEVKETKSVSDLKQEPSNQLPLPYQYKD